uniref:Uncharacterized protein n=1 Tax=Nelumbo nucifera TaxID=4432 RepID=A0A822XT85_NELNU|nr:TPA_asm: hypothetical protein HUJ06_023844 [Nelumbo nucifera]
MGPAKDSSDRLQWQKIFNAIVQMLQSQNIQLESLVKERKLLEDRIQIQHERWVSDVRLLEEQISQMKMDLLEAEMGQFLEAAKANLLVGLKQKEASLYKLKLGRAESELEDIKLWLDYLTQKFAEKNGGSPIKVKKIDKIKGREGDGDLKSVDNTKEEERRSKTLEGEVRKLKRAYESLKSKNTSEVSAILSERNFVWNQFKKLESDYNSLLKNKRAEVGQANEKIEKLLASLEQLQSSNNEKDDIILKLKTDLAKLEAEKDKSNKEISRLSKELELLRSSQSPLVTSSLNGCTAKSDAHSLKSKNNGRDRRPFVKKDLTASQTSDSHTDSEKGSRRSLKRRGAEAIVTSETPRLFSSTFKVPKLKNSPLLYMSN